ncbi:MAG TPA: hypothetical protein VF017_06525 [Thermoanaerobaculia bacterium]|nr:hypothetical protein [Thermoanaerobaculia bacterium]
MSQPTFDRLLAQLDRLGLWRAKETLPEALKLAEDSSPRRRTSCCSDPRAWARPTSPSP